MARHRIDEHPGIGSDRHASAKSRGGCSSSFVVDLISTFENENEDEDDWLLAVVLHWRRQTANSQ
jgi:hypothetical protein